MKFIDPTYRAPEPSERRVRGSALSKAQEAAIERSLSRYVALSCGHVTTKEVMVLYAVFGRVDTYCETCGDWFQLAPKNEPVILPEEPMF